MPSETELLDEVTALKAQVAELQEKLQQAGGESAAKLVQHDKDHQIKTSRIEKEAEDLYTLVASIHEPVGTMSREDLSCCNDSDNGAMFDELDQDQSGEITLIEWKAYMVKTWTAEEAKYLGMGDEFVHDLVDTIKFGHKLELDRLKAVEHQMEGFRKRIAETYELFAELPGHKQGTVHKEDLGNAQGGDL